ncbi:MAG TPA: ROK family protein [Bacteroidales bacterium]|nr:ROK family protein [Bacteroidales bacterium]HOU95980.1 ROK family protein [Bacteroidales bacterium]HQG36535.1 ROK family protein [Bacteroidales bacterium]HQG53025.1 ROK family protein [Bacteroidales bacterium]HQJ20647.1 ROK family protein [Bacteroidales bacterium]
MSVIKVAAGIDIGGTNTIFGLVDRDGKVLAEGCLKTTDYPLAEKFVETVYNNIMSLTGKTGYDAELTGFGMGAPMGNIYRGTIEYPAGLPWKGITPLVALFKKYTTLPVIITNDANAAAIGEMIYGGAKGMKDFVVLTLGTGLGSGFVANGKLIYGNDGFAGELGHTTVKPGFSERECGCGKKGCLETYVSATGLKRTLLKVMADSLEPSVLRKMSFEELDSKIIYEAAVNGDPLAKRAFEYTGKILGIKLADLVAHTGPEAIFLFGGLALAKEFIFGPAKKYMEENLLHIYRGKVKLLPSQIEAKNAAVLGASSLVWSELEND